MVRKHARRSLPDDDIPEMTAEDFARAKPLRDVMPEVVEAFKRLRGRPKSPAPKQRVSLRLDPKIVAAYKATGPGWQQRIGDTLAREARHLKPKRGASTAA
jgi:uncharacterized protein (DUF4415 family)